MNLTEENKRYIDSLTHYQLLHTWRFAPIGSLMMKGETGEYWGKRLAQKRDENPEKAVRDSKDIGWKK